MDIFNFLWRSFIGNFSSMNTVLQKFSWWLSRGLILILIGFLLFAFYPILGMHATLYLFGTVACAAGVMISISLFYLVIHFRFEK